MIDIELLVDRLFLSALLMPSAFQVYVEKPQLILLSISFMWGITSPLLLIRLSLFLCPSATGFWYVLMQFSFYLSFLLSFVSSLFLLHTWIYRSKIFLKYGKFVRIKKISVYIYFFLFLLLLHVSGGLIFSHRQIRLLFFFSPPQFFFFLCFHVVMWFLLLCLRGY